MERLPVKELEGSIISQKVSRWNVIVYLQQMFCCVILLEIVGIVVTIVIGLVVDSIRYSKYVLCSWASLLSNKFVPTMTISQKAPQEVSSGSFTVPFVRWSLSFHCMSRFKVSGVKIQSINIDFLNNVGRIEHLRMYV